MKLLFRLSKNHFRQRKQSGERREEGSNFMALTVQRYKAELAVFGLSFLLCLLSYECVAMFKSKPV